MLLSLLCGLGASAGCAARGNGGDYLPPEDSATGDANDASSTDDQAPTDDAPTCTPPELVCNGSCVDVAGSTLHCGRCNNRCATGQRCVNGACTDPSPTCASPRTMCGTTCVDTTSDIANCGGCGTRCTTGQSCVSGACRSGSTCASPRVMCGSVCTDVSSDVANCGVCGLTCSASQRCVGGNCTGGTTTCTSPMRLCGSTCTDVSFDANNCGACGNVCPSATPCISGRCGTTSTCTAPRMMCGSTCTDVSSDTLNCGFCGNRCATGQTCSASRCMSTSTGGTYAGAACTNPDPMGGTDPACGADLVCIPSGSSPICTADCTNSASQATERAMCGGGNSTCLTQGDPPDAQSLCLQACSPSATTGTNACRAGFVCTGWWYTHTGATPDATGCFPFCTADAQCTSGMRCNTRTGSCGATGFVATRLPDGSPCNPMMTVMVPGMTDPVNIQCRGLCFGVSSTSPTQGICGSFLDMGRASACPDTPATMQPLAPPGTDNLAICIFRSCAHNRECTSPLICRYDEAMGVPDTTSDPSCQYPTTAQRTGIP